MPARCLSLALAIVLSAGCDAPDSASAGVVSLASAAPAVASPAPRPYEMHPSATTTPPASEPSTLERPPPIRVAARTLAVSWQSYLGRRVTLACRPVRRIDFTRTLVVAGGAKFVVTGPPELVPCDATTSTFIVTGSTAVPIAGRTVLPELLLEVDDGEEPPR